MLTSTTNFKERTIDSFFEPHRYFKKHREGELRPTLVNSSQRLLFYESLLKPHNTKLPSAIN